MRHGLRFACAGIALVLLGGCSAGPPAPEWSTSAAAHLQRFIAAYLDGDSRAAAREFELARGDVASTGRPELVARVELNRCAAQVASLDLQPCTGFAPLAGDAGPQERAYAAYLAGTADAGDAALLPAQHRRVAADASPASVVAITDPFARLLAAGILLRRQRATPEMIAVAVETASRQGWRRPLLAWLGVQARLLEEAGDDAAAAGVRRRMDLVQPPRPAG